jgi:hypothetical protein
MNSENRNQYAKEKEAMSAMRSRIIALRKNAVSFVPLFMN